MTETERAEQAVIGAIMLKPTCIGRVDLVADEFLDPRHRLMFSTLRDLHLAKKPCDAVTLIDTLGDRAQLVGGFSAVSSMVTWVPTADNVEFYAEIVRRKALERTIKAAGTALAESDLPGDELLAMFQQSLSQVNKRVPDGATTMADLARETFDDISARVDGKKKREVVPTGLRELDHLLCGGLELGTTTVIGGGTRTGKSSLLRTIANNVARAGHGVDHYNLEAAKASLGRRALSDNSGIEHTRVRTFAPDSMPSRHEMQELIAAVDKLAWKRWRITSRGGLSSADIALRVRSARDQIDTRLVVVDYLQKMKEKGATRREEVGRAIGGLADLAVNENIPLLTASQFSRKQKDAKDRPPILEDFRESGDIEQDTDNALLIYHNGDWHGVIVAKQRDGPEGSVRLHWDKKRTAWRDFKEPA